MTTNKTLASVWLAALLILAAKTAAPAWSQEPVALEGPAGEALKAMCDYAGTLKGFDTQLVFSGTVRQGQIRQSFQETYRVAVWKPNRLALVPIKGIFGPTLVSDGQFLWIYLPTLHEYTKEPMPADFDQMLKENAQAAQIIISVMPVVGPTLISSEPCKSLLDGVEGVDSIEQTTTEGPAADTVSLRQGPLSWQLSVSQGEQRLPLNMELDLTELLKQRQDFADDKPLEVRRTWRMSDWHVQAALDEDSFKFTPPAGAREVERFSQTPENQPRHPLLGEDAPAFTLDRLDGEQVTLASHRDKNIVILDFWATWCKPCRDALPAMSNVAHRFQQQGVVFYAVNLGQTAADIRSFLEKAQLDVTVLLTGADPKLSEDYGIKGIPQTVVIGKDGKVKQVHVGYTPATPRQLQAELEGLIHGGFDLACKEILFAPEDAQVGQKLSFAYVVTNKGPGAIRAGEYSVVLSIDDQEVFAGPGNQDIPAGGEVTYSADPDVWHLEILEPGTYNYVIETVPNNPPAESNPEDNVLTGELKVVEAD